MLIHSITMSSVSAGVPARGSNSIFTILMRTQVNVECKSRYFCDLWPLCSCLLISIKILLQSRARLAHQALNVHINGGASFLLFSSPAVVTDGDGK